MKTHPIVKKISLNSLIILMFIISSCININPKSDENNNNTDSTEQNMTKAISEVILVDNGAVVPKPSRRRISWILKSPENILLNYTEQNSDDTTTSQKNMAVSDDSRDEVHDEIDRIAELAEDGLAIKPGKQPCTGMNSMNVEVVYNTGDTSRIAISGSVRCDPSLYPSVWALDSMATEIYRNSKGKAQ
jgi:hypothetical protein